MVDLIRREIREFIKSADTLQNIEKPKAYPRIRLSLLNDLFAADFTESRIVIYIIIAAARTFFF